MLAHLTSAGAFNALGYCAPVTAVRALAREPLIPEFESSPTGAKPANTRPEAELPQPPTNPQQEACLLFMARFGDGLLRSVTPALVD